MPLHRQFADLGTQLLNLRLMAPAIRLVRENRRLRDPLMNMVVAVSAVPI